MGTSTTAAHAKSLIDKIYYLAQFKQRAVTLKQLFEFGLEPTKERLLMAAQFLPHGRAVGVDVWSSKDQSGNAELVTRQNAALEGVAERVELHTADMRQLPFEDGSFDVVVSSLAIHNISGAGERAKAVREAARVLKSGGKLAIADIRHTRAYATELEACGLRITERRSLGVRFWYAAGPWAATRLVAAVKP